MKKIKEISGWLIALLVVLASCHTERQTQKLVSKTLANNDAFNTLGMYWQGLHPCANDSSGKTDTLFIPGKPAPAPDTVRRNDTVFITKPYPVHDTTKVKVTNTVVDRRAVQQAKDTTTKYKSLYEGSQQALASINELNQKQVEILKAEQAKALKASDKRGNGWMWKFWGLVGVCILYAGFKTGVIVKLFRLVI